MSSAPYQQLCRRFSLDEILSATQNFDDDLVVGKGGFGKVYKATINLESGESIIVAVKRLDSSSNQGEPEFWAEVEMLSKLRHCNLVSLIGYCNDNLEMILIYEFMPRGTLHDHLHKHGTSLSWVQRLNISIGAAQGLHYLHTGTSTKHGVIHRDVKSSNILLDEDYAAKISDFGLSKIGPINQSTTHVNTLVKGTFGYLDPEYFLTGRLTRKSDVFSFGVVLFELLCGRLAVDPSLDDEHCSLAKWAHECIEEGKLDQIVDSNIKGQIFQKCLKVFVQTADHCLCSRSKERPTMAEVLLALERSLSLQDKFDSRVQPAGIWPFTRMMKGLFISPEVNFAQNGTKPSMKNEDTINDGPSSNEDSGDPHEVLPFGEMLDTFDNASAQSKTKSFNDDINCASLSKEDSDDHLEVPQVEKVETPTHDLKRFSYSELESATRNFMRHMRLGEGEFWVVFKGWVNEKTYFPSDVDTGLGIAIKWIYHNKIPLLKKEPFLLEILREFRHPNLVKLLGYCFEDINMVLVYEFMENGSLDAHLFRRNKLPLPWNTRVKIAVGIAEGIYFLLTTQNQIENLLLQLHNILLDKDFNAKLSGFELPKLLREDSLDLWDSWDSWDDSYNGDPLYYFPGCAPETNKVALEKRERLRKDHIHALGEVLIQILTGRRISESDLAKIKKAMDLKGQPLNKRFRRALDPRLHNLDDTSVRGARRLAEFAFVCLEEPFHSSRLDRLRKFYTETMKY